MELVNSKRIQLTASYVLSQPTPEEQQELDRSPGHAIDKLNLTYQLKITRPELEQISLLIEQEPNPFVKQGLSQLYQLVEWVTSSRPQDLFNPAYAKSPARVPAAAFEKVVTDVIRLRPGEADIEWTASLKRLRTAPVGRLHLERIEMYPAGVERGEMIFTVPLAPRETVTISHKEWSTAGEEYENIVQDYFESYSERGVAEKTDMAMSTENESRHADAFNFSTGVSGGYGPVTVSTSIGLNTTSDNRAAAKQSAQTAREVTEKASARTRKEHKVSVKLETKRGVEDSSFRTITNPNKDKALRIDYYRMMRKWRTDLYRYGLRLTFDIAIANPGARLWAQYRKVRDLEALIRKPFQFDLKPADVNRNNWMDKAALYQVGIEPPPMDHQPVTITKELKDPAGGHEYFEFIAPPGTYLETNAAGVAIYLVAGGVPFLYTQDPDMLMTLDPIAGTGDGRLRMKTKAFGGGSRATVLVIYGHDNRFTLSLAVGAVCLPEIFENWQLKAWSAMRDSALAAYQANINRLQEERDKLWILLAGKDTLTLRRMEREELIRQTLYWLIGPSFDTAPDDVGKVITELLNIEAQDIPDDEPGGGAAYRHLSPPEWSTAAGWGDFVKFIHHAIEWENLLYFLYPYFWGSDDLGREKMLFEHPDPNHRDFLRAGYARVVVPVRPGFEKDLTEFLDSGSFMGPVSSPYLTIAEEVAAFARSNYAGIPPANPEKHARPLLYPQQRQTWDTMQTVINLIETYHEDNGIYPANLNELPGGPYKDAWGVPLVYVLPGSGNDYDLISYGKDALEGGNDIDADISAAAGASQVATWFDYTPTSGIDIELNAMPEIV